MSHPIFKSQPLVEIPQDGSVNLLQFNSHKDKLLVYAPATVKHAAKEIVKDGLLDAAEYVPIPGTRHVMNFMMNESQKPIKIFDLRRNGELIRTVSNTKWILDMRLSEDDETLAFITSERRMGRITTSVSTIARNTLLSFVNGRKFDVHIRNIEHPLKKEFKVRSSVALECAIRPSQLKDYDVDPIITVGNKSKIEIRDGRTGKKQSELALDSGIVVTMTHIPNSSQLVTAHDNGSLCVWNWQFDDGRKRPSYETYLPNNGSQKVVNIIANVDRKTIALIDEGNMIHIWDIELNRYVKQGINPVASKLCAISFTPDGKYLAALISRHIENPAESVQIVVKYWDAHTGEIKGEMDLLTVDTNADIGAGVFAPDQGMVACGVNNTVYVWSV